MRKIFCLFAFSVLLFSCQDPPKRECTTFKTGNYTTALLIQDTLTSSFTRTATLQIEKFNGNIDSFSVRWINDCEYVLKHLHPKNREEERSNHIKILTTTDSSYTFEFNTVGDSKKLRGSAFKID